MINKNARVNKRKYHWKKKSNKTQEKLGILISMSYDNSEVKLDKAIYYCAKKNIKIIEFMEFADDSPLENIQQFIGLINIVRKYQHQEKPLILIMQQNSCRYITQMILQAKVRKNIY